MSPMLFGPTRDEIRDKVRQEQDSEREAELVTYEQERDGQSIDEPRLRPLFGPTPTGDADPDITGTRVSLGPEDRDNSFFGALTFLIPDTTDLSIGVGPVYRPDYFGSDNYELRPDPQAYVKFRNFVFFDDDGVDFAVLGFSRFRFGPSLRFRGRRRDTDNEALNGLGDVGETFEFGGFAATTFYDRFSFKAKVRHGLKTGHRGTIVDGYLTGLLFRAGRFSLSASGQASWIGDKYSDAYFSVSPDQAISSGLPQYDADAGFRNVGGSINAYINIRDKWSLNPYATYDYVFGGVADTPIIDQFGTRHQFTVGFHLMREFRLFGDDD